MHRCHDMPYGATVVPGGGVTFRLWAPACGRVAVEIEGRREGRVAMERRGEGWFEAGVPDAGDGDRYRFVLEDEFSVPDPASRFQPEDVHGASQVVDPEAFDWTDDGWTGRPWEEAVLYEVHVGAFTEKGTFEAMESRLDHIAQTGITAIEIMPVADWPGRRSWGYDGVYLFAPDAALGGPQGFKRLINAAHRRGLMVFLDVVYNHFGPEGNYLGRYAPEFFMDRHHTPWGKAINFDGNASRHVRDFFVHNALYWLEEFNLDGLRFDAVHAIIDGSTPDILTEIAERVRRRFDAERHVHLVLENDRNQSGYLARCSRGRPRWYSAQWNDDVHHAMHVLATGEHTGYYADYQQDTAGKLARAFGEGFIYQGELSPFRHGARRGEPSDHLPPTAFVNFLQNHDQIGNRAFGERLESIGAPGAAEALLSLLLLAPSTPLLFMGEEWGAQTPFLFFCDFHDELAEKVRAGRRLEFAGFKEFSEESARRRIPDPNAVETFAASVLDWSEPAKAGHRERLRLATRLLSLRQKHIVPVLARMDSKAGRHRSFAASGILVEWRAGDHVMLRLTANLGTVAAADPMAGMRGPILYETSRNGLRRADDMLPPWWVICEAGPPALRAHLG